MKVETIRTWLVSVFVIICSTAFPQENIKSGKSTQSIIDSLKKSGIIFGQYEKRPEITLTKEQAVRYLQQKLSPQLWIETNDPLRLALSRLIYEAVHPPFDSTKNILKNYPLDSISIPWNKFYIWEPLRLKVPQISRPEFRISADTVVRIDSSSLIGSSQLKDTTILVVIDTLKEVASSYSNFPFRYFSYPFQSDSIKAAVSSLLKMLEERDSSIVFFAGIGKSITPIMMNSRTAKVIRYWLKNEFSDSVTVWIGNPSRNTIGLYLEQGVSFKRPGPQGNYAAAKINTEHVDTKKLLELQNISIKSQYWKYRTEAAFALNQASLNNWVKGGESSISTALDVTGYADYTNRKLKLSSNNFARFKFGYIKTGHQEIRKNLDLLETNSKLNHKAFGKFDFSAILLFKTQLAVGRNYFESATGEETTTVVSKFMNPAILTLGLGLDYKPNKTTSINFSPLSYKGTFVTDPAYYNQKYDSTRIDQTQYGIPKNRKSLNEPGASFMITNEFKPLETVTIVNRLQLFTNYIHNPQNIDVDWEMIATAKLNWFTEVRFNTHLIFDDDTKTLEQDKHGQPVLNPDGTPKKTARIQFKEMLGFSLSFRF